MLFAGDVGRGRRTINGPFGAVIKLDVIYHLDTSSSGSNSLNKAVVVHQECTRGFCGTTTDSTWHCGIRVLPDSQRDAQGGRLGSCGITEPNR